jgi:hypothetical protein
MNDGLRCSVPELCWHRDFFDFDVKEPDKALLNTLASIFGSEGAQSGAVMP